jgi:hypothetical protein
MIPGNGQDEVLIEFNDLLTALQKHKPNDRGTQDRYWAITITEVEKALAIFKTFAHSDTAGN